MKTAENILTTQVPVINKKATVEELHSYILGKIKSFQSINYIYLTDRKGVLKGVISIKELFRTDKNVPVSKIMEKQVVSAKPHTPQERVVHLALKNNIKAVPVTDSKGNFLGAVLNDKILEILHTELREDIFHLGGIYTTVENYDDMMKLSYTKSLTHRIPWLIVGLFGGIIMARIIGNYESVLNQNLILAYFVPLIVYISGAVSTQTGTFTVRDLAVKPNINFSAYVTKNIFITLSIGIILALILLLTSTIFFNNQEVGYILFVALITAVSSSIITGLLLPFLFNKLKLDPANVMGPIGTVLQDIISISIYFYIANKILL